MDAHYRSWENFFSEFFCGDQEKGTQFLKKEWTLLTGRTFKLTDEVGRERMISDLVKEFA